MALTESISPNTTSRVFIVCDQSDTAPIWSFIVREKGLISLLETSIQRALTRFADVNPDLIIIDVNASHADRMDLCRKIRGMSNNPILLFLPASNEMEILEAYQAGVDECVIKPISPAVFLAKILAWVRRVQVLSMSSPVVGNTIALRLDASHRSAMTPDGAEVKLTNLEFRLLRLLMSRPGHNFPTDELIHSVWGSQGESDVTLLKNVVYRLRKKLEVDAGGPYSIQTWPGGYSYQEE
jgi:DNA-binding response OmpR family regulator